MLQFFFQLRQLRRSLMIELEVFHWLGGQNLRLTLHANHEEAGVGAAVDNRFDGDVQLAGLVIEVMPDAFIDNHFLLLLGAAQRCHQGDAQVAAGHRDDFRTGATRRETQIASGIAEHMNDLETLVNQYSGGDVAGQQMIVDAPHAYVVEHAAALMAAGGEDQGGAQAVSEATVANLGEDLPVTIFGTEFGGQIAQTLARAQHQKTIGFECEMEGGDGPFLCCTLEINQQVATGHQINAGERRIAQQIVFGEDQRFTQIGGDLEDTTGLFDEILVAQLLRHVGEAALRVFAFSGREQRFLVQVGGQNLDIGGFAALLEGFEEQNRNRVGLFAGRAAAYPDAYLFADFAPSHQGGNDVIAQNLEGFRVAEETRHADQQVLVEQVQFGRILLDASTIIFDADVIRVQRDAAFDTARDGLRLVEVEIDVVHRMQALENGRNAFFGSMLLGQQGGIGQFAGGVLHIGLQCGRHVLGRQDGVDATGGDGTARHAVETRAFLALRQYQTARLPDIHDACATVRTGAGEHDGDGFFAPGAGQRAEKGIDWQAQHFFAAAVGTDQFVALDHHVFLGRQEENRVGANALAFDDGNGLHARKALQQFVHQALEIRRQVLDDHEGHAAIDRHGAEESFQRLQTAGRSADADDVRGPGGR